MSHSQKITHLLHATRNGITPGQASQVALLFSSSTAEEIAFGTAGYFHALIVAAESVAMVEHGALKGVLEFKNQGGRFQ